LDLLPDRNAGDAKLAAAAAIALHEHTHGVASRIGIELARGCADTAFETEADHACTAAYITFGNSAGRGGVQRFECVLGSYVQPVNVVEIAIVGFGHYRHRPPMPGGRALDAPFDNSIAHHPDTVRVGDHNRAL